MKHHNVKHLKIYLPTIGFLLLFYILYKIDIRKIIELITHIDIICLVLSLIAPFPPILLENLEWQLVLKKQKIKIKFTKSLQIIFLCSLFSLIGIFGVGTIAEIIYLKELSGENTPKCICNVFTVSILDMLSLLMVTGVASLFVIGNLILLDRILILTILSILALIFLTNPTINRKIFSIFYRIYAQLKFKRETNLANNLRVEIPAARGLILPLFISLIGWIILYTEMFLISTFFFKNLPYVYFLSAYSFATLVGCLPITYRGLGTTEMILVTTFSMFNIPGDRIVAFSLWWFFISMLPGFIGLVIYTVSQMKNNQM